jgi:CPA2 family monovalent cation:H+ antiporter-2
MEGHVQSGAYKDVVLFLATAGVVVPLFRRWRISPILGFLAAGVVLGPYGLGRLAHQVGWLANLTIENPEEVAQLAEFGVVFLLFTIGLELSWERLRRMRTFVFGLGGLQVALSMAALAGIAAALGQPPSAALAIGAALALSSTAIVMPSLVERKRQHAAAGRAAFAVLLFQDLAVAPMLVTLALVSGRSGTGLTPGLLLAFAPAAIGVAALVIAGRLVLRPMLRSVAKAKSQELFVAACLLVVIGSGLVSALAGLSMPLGGFIAGLLLAETEFRHEIEVVIEPFKGLLLGLFFVSIGIGLSAPLVVQQPALVGGVAIGLLLVNAAVVFTLALAFRLPTRSALEAAFLLAAGGEFAFVILGQAVSEQLVDRAIGDSVLVAATLTMIAIPGLAALGARIGGRRIVARDLPAPRAHRRLRPRRPTRRRDAAPPRHRLGRRRGRSPLGGDGPAGRRADLLRRRLAARLPGPLRARRGRGGGGDHGRSRRRRDDCRGGPRAARRPDDRGPGAGRTPRQAAL